MPLWQAEDPLISDQCLPAAPTSAAGFPRLAVWTGIGPDGKSLCAFPWGGELFIRMFLWHRDVAWHH